MTENEIKNIATLMQGFYPQVELGEAWQKAMIKLIGEYDYEIAEKAITEYARGDTRENPRLPAPGAIYGAIKNTYDLYGGIKALAKGDTPYDDLSEISKHLVSKETYKKMSLLSDTAIDEMELKELTK